MCRILVICAGIGFTLLCWDRGLSAAPPKDEPVHAGKSVQEWIKGLHDASPKVREESAEALGAIGPAAEAAVPALIATFKDDDNSVRFAASCALGDIGKAAVPALVRALDDPEYIVRGLAATALGQIGPDANAALPALRRLLEKETDNTRLDVAGAICLIRPRDRVALAALIDGLKDPSVRLCAALKLGRLGFAAKLAVPALIEALQDERELVRQAVAGALGQIGDGSAVPALAKALQDAQALSSRPQFLIDFET
jgi:HEAT repeat protein